MEVYSYQTNIDNYTAMLAALPSDSIPASLAQYASTDVPNLPPEMSDADVQTISDYQYRDKLRSLLRSEKVEQSKTSRVLDALKAQLGPTADAMIDEYKLTQVVV
jgi:hypothetical protein